MNAIRNCAVLIIITEKRLISLGNMKIYWRDSINVPLLISRGCYLFF